MLQRALTTKCCQEIIAFLLKKRGWNLTRIARTIDSPTDYVRRIQTGKQSFPLSEVEALAKACKMPAYRLIFDSAPRNGMSPEQQGLHDLVGREIERHEEFVRALRRKPNRKRRPRARAA